MKPCGFTPQDIKLIELFPWFVFFWGGREGKKERKKSFRMYCNSDSVVWQEWRLCKKRITRAHEGKPSYNKVRVSDILILFSLPITEVIIHLLALHAVLALPLCCLQSWGLCVKSTWLRLLLFTKGEQSNPHQPDGG